MMILNIPKNTDPPQFPTQTPKPTNRASKEPIETTAVEIVTYDKHA